MTNPPGILEWPRLRCLVIIQDRDDPTQRERARVHSWCTPNLREVYSNLDKGYSASAAKQAVPLLVSEINGLKKPEEAVRKFHLMVGGPDVVQPFLNVLDMGLGAGDDGELLGMYLDRLLSGGE